MPTRKRKVTAAEVFLWGTKVGAVAWNDATRTAAFEYAPTFIKGGQDISPLTMPRRAGIYSFPSLNPETFRGLPGLLADSLPDRFGNALIDLWLARQGRSIQDFSPVERLCYIGARGMGALEFKPALNIGSQRAIPLEITELTRLAQEVLNARASLFVNLREPEHALHKIIRVGTSAGGARAKAVIAWNRASNDVRSGDVPVPDGFEPWILKFDGLRDQELGDPEGFGRIEFAYYTMAKSAGIEMNESRLYREGGRAHFMTRRFDREDGGGKIHMQSLCGLAHYDYNARGSHSYEQALMCIQSLNLGYPALEQLYRRMVFNIVARIQDDHTRNIAFLMDRNGRWSLSPAFDVIWAYNPSGPWTAQHQMSLHGKLDGFERGDFLEVARQFGIKKPEVIIDDVANVVGRWPEFAQDAEVPNSRADDIGGTHRLDLGNSRRSLADMGCMMYIERHECLQTSSLQES